MLEMNTKNADFHFFKRQITSFGSTEVFTHLSTECAHPYRPMESFSYNLQLHRILYETGKVLQNADFLFEKKYISPWLGPLRSVYTLDVEKLIKQAWVYW